METGTNIYPLIGPYLPLDWNVTRDVTEENFEEHVHGRRDWYGTVPVSTASAIFHMQGACNTLESDPASSRFYAGCTDANNDISTGGSVHPTNLTSMIYRKSTDLVPFLKALHEYHQDIRDLGLYFANDGAGATINYPGFSVNGAANYTSIGCDWMRERNPYDPNRAIGTEEMIAKCRSEGESVSGRLYNPLERSWCRRQALNPEKVLMEGPYEDAWLTGTWLVTVGRAVYDRATNDFIACLYLGLNVAFLEDVMRESRVFPNSDVSIVSFEGGFVVASSAWNITQDGQPPLIYELDIGVSQSAYDKFSNLVSFDSEWDPDEVRELYESEYIENEGNYLVSYPFPPVPDEYDKNFVPDFLVLISVPESEMFEAVDDANRNVDDRVDRIILFSVLTGSAGVMLAACILLCMSQAITAPLRYMNETAQDIVNSFGSSNAAEDKVFLSKRDSSKRLLDFTPKSEITYVVDAFKEVVSSFSGRSLMARSEDARPVEVADYFPMRSIFLDLYKSRTESSEYAFSLKPTELALEDSINIGSNIMGDLKSVDHVKLLPKQEIGKSRFTSPLFLWTIILIVIPLLLTMVIIAAVSMTALTREFDKTIEESEAFLLEVEIKNLNVTSGLRATYASMQTSRPIRDLYLTTRYANWLSFGGLVLSNSVTSFQNTINLCKGYENPDDCPAVADLKVCDCQWKDSPDDCTNNTRHQQMLYTVVQSDGALQNGTRWRTKYPEICISPLTTEWWATEDMPVQTNTSTSSLRYGTSFDRARIANAASPAVLAIRNYRVEQPHGMGQYVAFHDDGMFVGSEGCSTHRHSTLAYFRSTEVNALINQDICPVDKFGYDPRCREWYDSAKNKAHDAGIALFVTAPYVFPNEVIAQSAVSPIIDPSNGYYVGQVLMDFSSDLILSALTDTATPLRQMGFPLLITADTDSMGGDVVIGPGFYRKESAAVPVASIVIKEDLKCAEDGNPECIQRVNKFNEIRKKMKDCMTGATSFSRRTADGDTETVYVAFAPVHVPFLDPVNSANFARGAFLGNTCIYSLALAETEVGIKEPFRAVEEDYNDQTRIAIVILACLIFLAIVIAVIVAYIVARSITEPMLYLLGIIGLVVQVGGDQDLPEFDKHRGSKELLNVSNTMETLFEVVQFANVAFYAGELDVAHRVLRDSLRIFRGMQNTKAISVACNNLGNILLVMYLNAKHEGVDSKFGLTRKDIISRGTAYYHEAIKLGEASYDEYYEKEGWTPNCLDFMQHLSNRYFNRAIFLLTIKDDHDQPTEIERLGFRDLQIARDMDVEIVDQGEEVGWGRINRSEKMFQAALTRVRGLLLLLEMGYPDEFNIEDKLENLWKIVDGESKKDSSDLFLDIGYVGRLQQVETELMKYCMICNEVDKAARIAIRSLFEDEYMLAEAKVQATQVMLNYLKLNGDKWDKTVRTGLKKWLDDSIDAVSTGLESERQSVVSESVLSVLSKSFVSAKSDLSESGGQSKPRRARLSINDHACVTMEKF
eukprot:scaffold13448_cov180-Amphora_coffeaeformis.AAC.1